MSAQPRLDRPRRNIYANSFTEAGLGFGQGVAEVVDRDRLQDVLKGISSVFAGCAHELVQAFDALEQLVSLKAVASFAFLDSVLAAALRAHGEPRRSG